MPIEYRMGLQPRVQGFVGAPIGWSNTQVALDTFEAFQNDGGFGDIDFGLTMQLVEATANKPYVIANISATAPTGGDPFTAAAGLAPTAPSLGQGFWSITGSLLCIKPYDPIVFFYGIGTERFFEREFLGLEIRPGAQYTYNFGVGFAVNERVTLSTRFIGAYVEELEVNGERRFGTNSEPMSIRLSATISQPCDRLVEPFVEFGITDDAISSFIGVTWTFSHSKRMRRTTEPRMAPAKLRTVRKKEKRRKSRARNRFDSLATKRNFCSPICFGPARRSSPAIVMPGISLQRRFQLTSAHGLIAVIVSLAFPRVGECQDRDTANQHRHQHQQRRSNARRRKKSPRAASRDAAGS